MLIDGWQFHGVELARGSRVAELLLRPVVDLAQFRARLKAEACGRLARVGGGGVLEVSLPVPHVAGVVLRFARWWLGRRCWN